MEKLSLRKSSFSYIEDLKIEFINYGLPKTQAHEFIEWLMHEYDYKIDTEELEDEIESLQSHLNDLIDYEDAILICDDCGEELNSCDIDNGKIWIEPHECEE